MLGFKKKKKKEEKKELAHTTVRRYSRRFRLKKMNELLELRFSGGLFHKKASETAMLDLFRSILALGY